MGLVLFEFWIFVSLVIVVLEVFDLIVCDISIFIWYFKFSFYL